MKKLLRFIGLLIGTMIILFNCSVYFVNSKDTDVTWNGYSFTIWNKKCWDMGNHIDWKYSGSKYYSNVVDATNIWNSTIRSVTVGRLKNAFRKDSSGTVCDITISDYSKKDGSNAYTSINAFSYGTVKLNKYYMDGLTKATETAVVVHELGHTMGISDNKYSDSIMYAYTPKVNIPQARDRVALEYVMRQYTTIFG